MLRTPLSLLSAGQRAGAVRWSVGAVLLWLPSLVLAQLPSTQLTSVFPPGGKQGATVEVTIAGAELDDASALLFSHAGISAKPVMSPPDEFLNVAKPVDGKFTVTIAGDVPTGIYDVRVISRFGSSNPRAFHVGGTDEVLDDGQNKTLATAKVVPVGTTISGRLEASTFDYYKVTLKKGQRIIAECLAERLDSKADANVLVLDGTGRELARERNTIGLDPIADFTAPADGDYIVAIIDAVYGGGADHVYRLQISDSPYVDFVFPPSGPAGSNNAYTVYGRNLPGGQASEFPGLQKVNANIALPADPGAAQASSVSIAGALLAAVDFRLGKSNTVPVGIAESPVVVEQEPNDQPAKAQKITVPAEYVGRFYPARDLDWVQFDAKKGDVFVLDVISHRLGLPADPYLIVQKVAVDAMGKETVTDVTQVDDPADRATKIGAAFDYTTDDPSYRLAVTDDSTYRVMVRDQFGDGRSDPRFSYRLVIRKEQPDFAVVLTPTPMTAPAQNQPVPLYSPSLNNGGTTLVQSTVVPRDGFAGDVTLSVEGLPTELKCAGAVVTAGSAAPLVFAAAENSPAWSGNVRVKATAKIGDKEVVRYARTLTIVWGTANAQQNPSVYRAAQGLTLAVAQKQVAPAFVQAGDDNMLETSLGGKLEVPVKITRRGDFNADLKLVAQGPPAEWKPKDLEVKAGQADAKLEIAVANQAAKPGVYTFYLQSDAKLKYARNPDAVNLAKDEAKKLEEIMKTLNEDLKKAQEAKDEPKTKELQEKIKRATAAKTAMDKKVGDLDKANAPKDVTAPIVSTPVKLRIHAAPFKVQLTGTPVVKPEGKIEVPVKVERQFGFDDQIDLAVTLPGGVAGITAGKLSIAKGQNEGKLELTAAKNATIGQHSLSVKATGKFNTINVERTEQLALKVEM